MALSARELMIAVTATDNASATINGVAASTSKLTGVVGSGSLKLFAYSQVFTKVGAAAQRAGTYLLGIAVAAGKAAMSFDHAMALAQTQARLSSDVFKRVSQSALDISSKYGVAATDIAAGLYDIFSTTKDNAKQAVAAVDTLTKASVAGATTMSTVTRGVIDIQNAFGKAAGSTTDVLDLQFQMLRKSGGTYDELVAGFGNVISAASQMDQTLQTAAGSIAFLTLRGRTQAQASISVSRALDQLSKSAGDVKKVLGVSVFDASGKFRQLNAIITDMSAKMQNMTSQERAKAFYDMFGAGSIQANRFFRIAVPQADALNASIKDVGNNSGALQKAFNDILKNDPSFVFNKLAQSVKNLGISIANTLAPAFQGIVKSIQGVVDWFNNLSTSTKEQIGRWTIIAGVFLVVTGVVLKFAGSVMFMVSILKLAGQAVGGIGTIMTGASVSIGFVVVAIAGLAAAAFLLYKNWDTVSAWWKRNWAVIKQVVIVAVGIITVLIGQKLVASITKATTTFSKLATGAGEASGLMQTAFVGLNKWIAGVQLNFAFAEKGIKGFTSALINSVPKAVAYGLAVAAVGEATYKLYKLAQDASKFRGDLVTSIGVDPAKLAEAERQLKLLNDEIANSSAWDPRTVGTIIAADQTSKAIDEAKQKIADLHTANALILQDMLKMQGYGSNTFGPFAASLEGASHITMDMKTRIAGMVGAMSNLGGSLDKTVPAWSKWGNAVKTTRGQLVLNRLAQIDNLRSQGDLQAASKKSAELFKMLKTWTERYTGVLKHMVPVQDQVNGLEADHAARLLATASAQNKANNAILRSKGIYSTALGPLKNLVTYTGALAANLADMANKSTAAANALRNLNGVPTPNSGGSHHSSGGSNSGGHTAPRTTTRSTTDRNVTINVRDNMRGRDIARELDWAYRTGTG